MNNKRLYKQDGTPRSKLALKYERYDEWLRKMRHKAIFPDQAQFWTDAEKTEERQVWQEVDSNYEDKKTRYGFI